jgi:hypothetical protein
MAVLHSFHPMIQLIDLTVSDDEIVEILPITGIKTLSALPLRQSSPCFSSQRKIQYDPLPRKRYREDPPHPHSDTQNAKRPCYSVPGHKRLYTQGVLKPVRLAGSIRSNDITLQGVLQVHALEEAVLCSFQWDVDWLLDDLGLADVKTTWVGDDRYSSALQMARPPQHRPCLPKRPEGFGTVHGKLMLLFRTDGFLRIAIPTANLRRQEWGVVRRPYARYTPRASATLDNAVFLIDLPRYKGGPNAGQQVGTPFHTALLEYVECLGLDSNIQAKILQYDFKNTEKYGFVYTGYVDERSPADSLELMKLGVRRRGNLVFSRCSLLQRAYECLDGPINKFALTTRRPP